MEYINGILCHVQYISSYIILSILIYICTEISMDKYLLNHKFINVLNGNKKIKLNVQ